MFSRPESLVRLVCWIGSWFGWRLFWPVRANIFNFPVAVAEQSIVRVGLSFGSAGAFLLEWGCVAAGVNWGWMNWPGFPAGLF
jgi:hypothetical protein